MESRRPPLMTLPVVTLRLEMSREARFREVDYANSRSAPGSARAVF